MAKPGLVALADAYGLERTHQQKFKLLTERLLQGLSEGLAKITAHSVRLSDSRLATQSFSELCARDTAPRLLVFAQADKPLFALQLEAVLERSLLDALLGSPRANSAASAATPPQITPTEGRMLKQLFVGLAAGALSRTLTPLVGRITSLKILGSREGNDGVAAGTFAPSEMLLSASGRLSLDGREGVATFGFPLARALQVAAPPVTPAITGLRVDQERKIGTLLAASSLTLEAVLGKVQLPLNKVKELGPGSVILLGRIERKVPTVALCAAGRTLFGGTIVADRGWYRFLLQREEKSSGQSDNYRAA